MQGYAILAEALSKEKIQHCYGIVGTSFFTQESLSSNSALPSKAMESTTTGSEMSNRPATVQATLDISQEFLESASVFQAQATQTPSVELPMHGLIAGL